MITLAAFALTMLPMAAFAAEPGSIDAEKSTVAVKTQKVEVNDEIGIDVTLSDINVPENTNVSNDDVYVWATDSQNKVTKNIVFGEGLSAFSYNKGYAVKVKNTNDVAKMVASEPDTYTLHAGIMSANEMVEFVVAKDATATVEVTPKSYSTIKSAQAVATEIPVAAVNGVETFDVNVYALADETGIYTPENVANVNGAPVTVVNDNDEIEVIGTKDLKTENGLAKFTIKPAKGLAAMNYYMTVKVGSVETTLEIAVTPENQKNDNEPATIEAVPVENAIDADAAKINTALEVVKFVVKNKDGKVLGNDVLDLKAYKADNDYVVVVDQPKKSDLAAKNVLLAEKTIENEDAIVLQLAEKTSLVAGDYTVRAYLDNGEYADTTFTVAAFDEDNAVPKITSDKEIEIAVADRNDIKDTDVMSGTISINNVDKNDVKKPVKGYVLNLAVDQAYADKLEIKDVVNNGATGADTTFNVVPKAQKDAKLAVADIAGAKINVTALVDGKILIDTITLVDNYVDKDFALKLDPVEGLVKKVNVANLTIEDKNAEKNADTKAIETFVYEVKGQSNKDAKVTVKKSGNAFKIQSDKATTVDIAVTAIAEADKGAAFGAIYTGEFTYTIGEPEAPETDSIAAAMTIGAKQVVVNNKVVELDVAPFVENSRTYVPFRAFGEEVLGAKVGWDEKTQTVSYELNGKTVEMVIGSKTFKVNGEEKTMDVAPVIVDNRTFVPVRFLAENFDVEVTPVYAANGTTAGVIFVK